MHSSHSWCSHKLLAYKNTPLEIIKFGLLFIQKFRSCCNSFWSQILLSYISKHLRTFHEYIFWRPLVCVVCLISFCTAAIYLHIGLPAPQGNKMGGTLSRTHKHRRTHAHKDMHTKLWRKTNWAEWDFLSRRQRKLLFQILVWSPLKGDILRNWRTDRHLVTSTGSVASPSAEHTNTLWRARACAQTNTRRKPLPPTE